MPANGCDDGVIEDAIVSNFPLVPLCCFGIANSIMKWGLVLEYTRFLYFIVSEGFVWVHFVLFFCFGLLG